MKSENIRDLVRSVQTNCHISDARHGADYSLCVYLMKMREYYRWEQGLPYGAILGKDKVGDWLAAREQLWENLEEAEFEDVAGRVDMGEAITDAGGQGEPEVEQAQPSLRGKPRGGAVPGEAGGRSWSRGVGFRNVGHRCRVRRGVYCGGRGASGRGGTNGGGGRRA